eukprot:m.321551 g.321551  ORF g.321551 m.321551 type:complete len:53 (+) comp15999_c0_seq2:814-972(+)
MNVLTVLMIGSSWVVTLLLTPCMTSHATSPLALACMTQSTSVPDKHDQCHNF